MSYFDQVYLKRINRFGTNLQQRVVNDREYEFHNFIQKSPNKVVAFTKDESYEGVLQTKEVDEIDTINYFLTYKSIDKLAGQVLKILDISEPDNEDKNFHWLPIYKDHFTSTGYNRYTIIKLERQLTWVTKEGYLYKTWVHISGAGSNARDIRILNKYRENNNGIVYMPPQTLTITMPDNNYIERGTRITIKDITWKISGIDNITNDGIAYVTLEQDYTDVTDLPIASQDNLEHWSFHTNWVETSKEQDNKTEYFIELPENIENTFEIQPYYFNNKDNSVVQVEIIKGNITYNQKDKKIIGEGKGIIKIYLQDSPNIFKVYNLNFTSIQGPDFKVLGPTILKMGKTEIFSSNLNNTFILENNNPSIEYKSFVDIDGKQKIKIKINEMINNIELIFKEEETNKIYKLSCKVISPWIGGM